MFTLSQWKNYKYTGTPAFEFQLVWKESRNSAAINWPVIPKVFHPIARILGVKNIRSVSSIVTVLQVALCPGESHCSSAAKHSDLSDSRISLI